MKVPSRRRHVLRWRTTIAGITARAEGQARCAVWSASGPGEGPGGERSAADDRIPAQQRRSAPFFRSSGLPFFTVAMTMSPTVHFGRRLRREPKPLTEMMYKFLAPVLSAQFITAATFIPIVVRNLLGTEPERPARLEQHGPGGTHRERPHLASVA
jgi:hypothetical protein